jgi:hypothetical protein
MRVFGPKTKEIAHNWPYHWAVVTFILLRSVALGL